MPQAVNALMEQAQRFDTMSVCLAKSANLATSQADEIAQWTSRLIEAVTRIRQESQDEAASCRARLQVRMGRLKAQADLSKRKILDTSNLESSQTIKANLRLIFGPAKEKIGKSKSTKAKMVTNLIRINTIRSLCESKPHSVIALLTTYPTKTWTESSPDVFHGIIKLVENETEQDWPEEIIDCMDALEMNMPMSAEFRQLRGMVNSDFAFLANY